MNSKVSVIIPAYNSELTISQCLESVISQTYSNIEIIVVNDGAVDQTKQIVEKYINLDKRVKLFNQKNSGVSVARNNGIKNATGDYILFVDCDDWLENNMIEKMVNIQKKYNVDVVRCNFYDDRINGTTIAKMYDLSNKQINLDNFDKYNVREHFLLNAEPIKNLVMLLLIKKDILINNNIYFDKSLYMMEDVVYYQKLFNTINSIYFLDEPLYHYVENENSVTHSVEKYEHMIYGILDTNQVLTNFLKKNNLLTNKLKLLNANHMRIIINYLYYIYIRIGKKELQRTLKILYRNNNFMQMLKESDKSEISYQFSLFFKMLIKKNISVLMILFKIKQLKIKE